MESNKQNTALLVVIAVATLLVAVVGATFAYFTAANNQGSTATVTTKAGSMKIDFNDGTDKIVPITNIQPSNNVLVNKTFTVTGTNTTNATVQYSPADATAAGKMVMPFTINLIYTTSFKNNDLHVWLKQIGSSADATATINGTTSTNETFKDYKDFALDVASTETTLPLATGSFNATGEAITLTFNLKMTFPDTGRNQDTNKEATFNGRLSVVGDKAKEVTTTRVGA